MRRCDEVGGEELSGAAMNARWAAVAREEGVEAACRCSTEH
jgi:hypothetical protein